MWMKISHCDAIENVKILDKISQQFPPLELHQNLNRREVELNLFNNKNYSIPSTHRTVEIKRKREVLALQILVIVVSAYRVNGSAGVGNWQNIGALIIMMAMTIIKTLHESVRSFGSRLFLTNCVYHVYHNPKARAHTSHCSSQSAN